MPPAETAKPATRRKTPARSRKKAAAPSEAVASPSETPAADTSVEPAGAPSELAPGAVPADAVKPAKPKRAPRKPKAKPADAVAPVETPTAAVAPAQAGQADSAISPVPVVAEPAPMPVEAVAEAVADLVPATTPPEAAPEGTEDTASDGESDGDAEAPAGPRRKRKRRRGKGERADRADTADAPADDIAGSADASPVTDAGVPEPLPQPTDAAPPSAADAPAEPAPLPPLTIVSLGLEQPPALSGAALAALRAARLILGTADALDRLAGLGLEAPQALCSAESIHLDLRRAGHAGSVLVTVGDGAGDGPALELLGELGPAHVRVLPGVGRVQAACAALGLSSEIVALVDLRRAPLAALRGQLRAHRLLAVPVADAGAPGAVARLLVDSGFAGARVWVCEWACDGATDGAVPALKSTAWLATELAELRDPIDPHAVLIVATGPSAGVFAEVPGLTDAALGEDAPAALPLAARLLALAWLQPAAWETGWAIADGEASLALEWARAVPTARVRAVGVEPSLLGLAMARAGVGENLAAIPAASPLRCREWPAPEAVFVRGGVGLSDWLAAAWARLAPGGRLVASAEDDHARADLLAFAAQVPAEAWQELSLSRGETVAGRLRFAPAAPVRLALWRKPLN